MPSGKATAFRRQVAREVDLGNYVSPTTIRLADYLDDRLAKLHRKPQTVAGYHAKIRLQILPRLGYLPLLEVTAGQLNRHYRLLETEGSVGVVVR